MRFKRTIFKKRTAASHIVCVDIVSANTRTRSHTQSHTHSPCEHHTNLWGLYCVLTRGTKNVKSARTLTVRFLFLLFFLVFHSSIPPPRYRHIHTKVIVSRHIRICVRVRINEVLVLLFYTSSTSVDTKIKIKPFSR